ncbi:MAG: NAD(+) synthase [bacterium]|nr:NAD(+) synthase [bacterium]
MKNNYDWYDLRHHRFARVSLGVTRTHIGAPRKNLDEHMQVLQQMKQEGSQFAGFQELSITGYSCDKMFQSETLQEATLETLAELAEKTRNFPMLITVGAPIVQGTDLYNCAISFYGGRPLSGHIKSFLPNYREFLEHKFFIPGYRSTLRQMRLLGTVIPCGWDILLKHKFCEDFILHHELCEDMWVPISPSAFAALWGAMVEMNLSASNITIGKDLFRQDLVKVASGKNNNVYLYVSAGPGEGNRGLAWDNQILVAERGNIIAQGEQRFGFESSHLTHDVDLGSCVQDRLEQHTFSDNKAWIENMLRPGAVDFRVQEFGWLDQSPVSCPGVTFANRGEHSPQYVLKRKISRTPFVPEDPAELTYACETVHRIQTHALACRWRYMQEKQQRKVKLLFNLSGGRDSVNVAGVIAHAADLLHYDHDDVVCLSIPGFGTTDETRDLARTIGEAFGFDFREIPIAKNGSSLDVPLSDRPEQVLGLAEMLLLLSGHDGLKEDLAFENAQAWLRTVLALTIGAREIGMFIGTGTMTEAAVGWFTMHGDGASHFNPNASMPKSLEKHVLLWMADHVFVGQPLVRDAFRAVAGLAPSPELTRLVGGKRVQITDEIIGPEILREFFLFWGLRFGRRPSWINRAVWEVFSEGEPSFSLPEIVKWQKVFWRRFFDGQYKRNCVPDSVKLGLLSLSPLGGDFVWPTEGCDDEWQADCDRVP